MRIAKVYWIFYYVLGTVLSNLRHILYSLQHFFEVSTKKPREN